MNINVIIDHVLKVEGLERKDVLSPCRKHELVIARFIIWGLSRKFTDLRFAKLGAITNRTHASVITGLKRFDNLLSTEKKLKEKFDSYVDYFKYYQLRLNTPNRTYRLRPVFGQRLRRVTR